MKWWPSRSAKAWATNKKGSAMKRALVQGVMMAGLLLAAWPVAAQDMGDGPILQGPVRVVPGPMRSIAVGQIDAMGALAPPGSGWNVGGSLSAMLTTALQESGR